MAEMSAQKAVAALVDTYLTLLCVKFFTDDDFISASCKVSMEALEESFPFLGTLKEFIGEETQSIKGENQHGERQAGGFQKENAQGGKKAGPRPN